MDRMELNANIGNRIRKSREYMGLSREKAAEEANISTQFLSDIESGRKSMTTSTLYNLCSTLGVSADYVLFGTTQTNESSQITNLIRAMSPKETAIAEDILKSLIRGFAINK